MQDEMQNLMQKCRMLRRTCLYQTSMQCLSTFPQPDLTVAPDRPTKAADDSKRCASQKGKEENSFTGYRGVRPSRSRIRRVRSFSPLLLLHCVSEGT